MSDVCKTNPWDKKPNGCADEEHWKECVRKGYLKRGCSCLHPGDSYVDNRDGYPICRHHPNAVKESIYMGRKDNESK